MKLIEALQNVDKSNPDYYCVTEIAEDLGFSTRGQGSQTRLCGYYLMSWMSNRYLNGKLAIYLDDCVVGMLVISELAPTEYKWVSKEALNKLKLYLSSIYEEYEEYNDYIASEETIEPTYTLSYVYQLTTSSVIYKGKLHTIEAKIKGNYPTPDKVQLNDVGIVSIKDINIPLNLSIDYKSKLS
jgi:hypothetical protein